ncbi:MAG: hypothetical protein SFU55_10875 [Methylophilus sp.]|nr:hypothetical protein [Methylophilus sp.]
MNVLNTIDCVSLGIKGPNAAIWLQQQGIPIPESANTWLMHPSGYVLRLGQGEFLIEGAATTQLHKALENKVTGVYFVPRAYVAFELSGAGAKDMMAQICALNTTELLLDNALLMTQVAGVSAILINDSNRYRFWCDVSYQDYIEHTLSNITE